MEVPQTSSAPVKTDFGGHFDSHGGPQFLANTFDTNGTPINFNFDSNQDNRLPVRVCELPAFILSPYFSGRGDELQQIDRAFSTSSGDLPRCYVVHGMPGVGKTQLALKFATLAFQKGQYPYVFWVSAASVEKLSQDVSKIVDLLRLPGRHTLNQASKLNTARGWLEASTVAKSWLVVLDNISEETATTILLDFLPRENYQGRILMTTRVATVTERYTALGGSPQMALQSPGIDDAIAILSAGAKLNRERKEEISCMDAERLVRSVGNLPLAIDQAASYIRETGCSSQELLNIYKSDEVLEMLSWENDLSGYEEKSVVATFTPALNRIQQTAPDAVILLRLLCFCDPEGIPLSIFMQGYEGLYQEDRDELLETQTNNELKAVKDLFQSRIRLSKAIQVIQRLSLVAQVIEGTERIIRIHDLVHLLLRSKLMTDTERGQWLRIAINIICKAFEEIGDHRSPQNWSRCSRFVSHIESLESFAEQYGIRDNKILDASMWAAVYLDECGLYEKAATLNKRTLARQKSILGERHPSTLSSMNNLAEALKNLGKYEEAERIHRQTLASMETILGKEYPETLISIDNLAVILRSQGKYEEAERIHRQTLASMETILGKEHPDTLTSTYCLAYLLHQKQQYKDAGPLYDQACAGYKKTLGDSHPTTAACLQDYSLMREEENSNR